MSFLSADDITQAEHYTKQTEVKRWLILMLYFQQIKIVDHNTCQEQTILWEAIADNSLSH